ncbi:mannosyl-oligosaccharide glucosidase [Homo sapiens]|nr:mannosyl-oligosaccharide glucosidase [Homo sapiens]KAI4035120.1 mannosyl-oligosaccharide glucosidase [Homo sapiens]
MKTRSPKPLLTGLRYFCPPFGLPVLLCGDRWQGSPTTRGWGQGAVEVYQWAHQ